MNAPQKILVFCPPFNGHFNVIKNLIKNDLLGNEWKLVITGWYNTPLELGNLAEISTILAESELNETDPSQWTFPRVNELLGQCLAITENFQPDLIIYDFFSLEGRFVGDITGIPAWSSIPAFIGAFMEKEYLKRKLSSQVNTRALAKLSERYGIYIDKESIEMASDGLHISGDINLVWSYESITSKDFMTNR